MKTSVIEIRDMLSVLGVDDLEKQIREVPGIESATVNFAAGNATVRYDETRIEIADIKSAVRQRGLKAETATGHEHQNHTGPGTPEVPAAPKATPLAPATVGAASASSAEQPKAAPPPSSKPSPAEPPGPPAHVSTAPKSPPDAAAAAPAAHAGHDKQEKAAPDKR